MMVAQQVCNERGWGQQLPAPPQRPAPANLLTSQYMPPPPPSKPANTGAAKSKKTSSNGATRGRVLFGISGIARLPAIRDSEPQSDIDRDFNPVVQGKAPGPMQGYAMSADPPYDAEQAFSVAQECEEQAWESTSSPACGQEGSQPACPSVLHELEMHAKPSSPVVTPVRSVKGTSWADLYDPEEEADDISSTCDSGSDHRGSLIGTQPLSEPSSPRSSCAFAHIASQSSDMEDADSHCCPAEACEDRSVEARVTASTVEVDDNQQQLWSVSTDSWEGHQEILMPQLPQHSIEEVTPKAQAVASLSPSKSQLKKQRKAAAKQSAPIATDRQSCALAPAEDSIKLSRQVQSAKPQKQVQKQCRRTMSSEVELSEFPKTSDETRCGHPMCRAVLGWLRLFMRVAQRYPVSTVLAVTMLGYGGMLMPGLSHASQPQLPQPGDASQMAGRTLHPKKKALPLVDGEASPKAKATKNGKAARKPSLKYTRLEM